MANSKQVKLQTQTIKHNKSIEQSFSQTGRRLRFSYHSSTSYSTSHSSVITIKVGV
jgi:hypothetical protein